MQSRSKYITRSIMLRAEQQRDLAVAALRNAPLDDEKPLELVIREQIRIRKPDQNSAMWSGPLADIAEQAYVERRTYSAKCWHEVFKAEYLPEEFDPELCKEGYRKYENTPNGNRVLVGSTTELTIHGFALYMKQVEAYGALLGVQFHASPNERQG